MYKKVEHPGFIIVESIINEFYILKTSRIPD